VATVMSATPSNASTKVASLKKETECKANGKFGKIFLNLVYP